MKRIIISFLVLQSFSARAQTITTLKPVNEFQQDSWSCGVHSTYRSLHNYDLANSYGYLKSFIGQHEFKYDVTKSITEKVNQKVCKKLGPLKHFCEEVTKVVTRVTTVKVPMNLGIGRSPPQLSGKINDYGVRAFNKERASLEDLEALLDRRQPVLTLIQIGVEGWELLSYPKLHWIVVSGYDAENFYYYDTDSNTFLMKPRAEFYKEWDWNNGWNKRNSPVHLHLSRNEGLEVRSIVAFDDQKIDRVVLLEDLESRAVVRLNAAQGSLDTALSNPKTQEVSTKNRQIERAHADLDIQINALFDELNPLLTAE